jgi:hypothetical protein
MSSENNTVIKPNQSQDANLTIDKSRRSFAIAGVVTPVIMTLASRTALGAVCTTSGFVSATATTVSGGHNRITSCGGLSPGAYKTPNQGAGTWVSPYSPGGLEEKKDEGYGKRHHPNGTLMSVGFSYAKGYLANDSMYDVLWLNGQNGKDGYKDRYNLGAHLVAALLNAAAGRYTLANGLTVANVKDMYAQLSGSGGASGRYSPAPNVFWNAQEVVAFLAQTMN